jgi:2-phospho-L-lactate guanylyltransferase
MRDWVLVVPVKRLAVAKTRLAAFAGPHRARLALAFAADTLLAADTCALVRGIVVVTDDAEVAAVASSSRHLVVSDEPDAGLNPALEHGAEAALAHWPGARIAALSSDLPALRPEELGAALQAAEEHAAAFVPDAAATGTTLLTASTLEAFAPRFGRSSAAAHEAAGAVPLSDLVVPSLRQDVDTEADLRTALTLGVGPLTAAVISSLGSELRR